LAAVSPDAAEESLPISPWLVEVEEKALIQRGQGHRFRGGSLPPGHVGQGSLQFGANRDNQHDFSAGSAGGVPCFRGPALGACLSYDTGRESMFAPPRASAGCTCF